MESGSRVRLWTLWWLCAGAVCSCYGLVNYDAAMVAGRQQKLQELLRTLGTYSKTQGTDVHTTEKIESTTLPSPSTTTTTISPNHPEDSESSQSIEIPGSASVKSYQDFYRVFYGNQEGVNHLKKQYGPNGLQKARANFGGVSRELEDVRQANEHFLRIRTRARCKVPAPRVVRVRDYYPDPSREYLPRCTVIHQCGDTTGCCDNDAFHCVPSAMQEVALHFYTLTVDKYGLGYQRAENRVERLLFVNHTACHCQPLNDLPRISQNDFGLPSPPRDGALETSHSSPNNAQSSKCRECPVPFTSRVYRDGRCGCDCFDRQKPCLRVKRGRESLSDVERRCVEANYCHIPDCEYGIYDHQTGFCPRRHDEVTRPQPANHRPHPPHNHRWAFMERD